MIYSKENPLCSPRKAGYGMHYGDERQGTLFSMLTGAAEWEDAYLGNDKKKLKKGEADPACVHVNGLSLACLKKESCDMTCHLKGLLTETLVSLVQFSAPLNIKTMCR